MTIDPLNPGNAPLYQMPVECRVIGYKVTDKVVSLATGTQIDSTDQSKNYGDDLKHVVAELPAGQVRQIYWWIRLPNQDPNLNIPRVRYKFQFKDGHEKLKVANYQQSSVTIDLTSGQFEKSFTPPLFDDSYSSTIVLQNPSLPARNIYFKRNDKPTDNQEKYFIFQMTENSDPQKVVVRFNKVQTNLDSTFELIACYSFGQYSNLQDLCNTAVKHKVINALGTCFSKLKVNAINTLKQVSYELGSSDIPKTLDLSQYLRTDPSVSENYGLGKVCGSLGFKVMNETQAEIISVSQAGQVQFKQVFDQKWLGLHILTYQVYLKDIDPSAIHAQSVDQLTHELEVTAQYLNATKFEQALVRQAPISLQPIAPRYYIDLNKTVILLFQFADPLVFDHVNGSSLKPLGLNVTIVDNMYPDIVMLGKIDQSHGLGLANVTLIVDGQTAFQKLQEAIKDQQSSSKDPISIDFVVTLQVNDTSPGGLPQIFKLQFVIAYSETDVDRSKFSITETKSTNESEQTSQQTSDFYIAQLEQNDQIQELEINGLFQKEQLHSKYLSLDVKKPLVRVQKISRSGTVSLKFSNKMMKPERKQVQSLNSSSGFRRDLKEKDSISFEELLQVREMIDVTYVPSVEYSDEENIEEPQSQDQKFTWNITAYLKEHMELQLFFQKPNLVSQSGEDVLQVNFKNTSLIYDWAGKELQNGTQVETYLPPQYSSPEEKVFFETIEEIFSGFETHDFSSNFVLNTIFAGILQAIWSSVSSQQIVILVPLFHISLPANAQTIFAVLLQIAAFESIPTDEFYDSMLDQLDSYSDQDYVQQKLSHLGFETQWLLPNLGSISLFIGLVYPLMMMVLLILYSSVRLNANSCKQRHYNLQGTVFWNWPINFLRDSFVVIMICCLYNSSYLSWSNEDESINSGLAVALLTVLLLYPIAIQCFLYKSRNKLETEDFKHKIYAAYDGLATEDYKFILYPLLFYYRRVVIPASIIIWPNLFLMQYLVLLSTSILTVILIAQKKPFASKVANRSELIQESTLILLSYHVLCFSQWITDIEMRHSLGYSVIACVLGQLFVTLFINAFFAARQYCQEFRRRRFLLRAHANATKQLQKNRKMLQIAVIERKAWRLEDIHGTPEQSFDESAFWEGEFEDVEEVKVAAVEQQIEAEAKSDKITNETLDTLDAKVGEHQVKKNAQFKLGLSLEIRDALQSDSRIQTRNQNNQGISKETRDALLAIRETDEHSQEEQKIYQPYSGFQEDLDDILKPSYGAGCDQITDFDLFLTDPNDMRIQQVAKDSGDYFPRYLATRKIIVQHPDHRQKFLPNNKNQHSQLNPAATPRFRHHDNATHPLSQQTLEEVAGMKATASELIQHEQEEEEQKRDNNHDSKVPASSLSLERTLQQSNNRDIAVHPMQQPQYKIIIKIKQFLIIDRIFESWKIYQTI